MKPHLSIAIPVFNQDVSPLVYSLKKQVKQVEKDIEILVFDDGSQQSWRNKNRALSALQGVKYSELPSNIGRAAIRNKLARAAEAEHVLFLDGDSVITENDFLLTYLQEIDKHPQAVICGGRNYPKECPGVEYSLHWYYGSQRESKPAETRARSPHGGFHSNNFAVPVAVWHETPFDENLRQYGHEDTLLGYELMLKNIEVRHIENPTVHGQLETNSEFLNKTRQAMQNLKLLYDRGNDHFNQWHRMLWRYDKLKRWHATLPVALVYKIMRSSWEQHLSQAPEPSLRTLNLYRFGYLCTL